MRGPSLFPLPTDCPFARDYLPHDLLDKITNNRLLFCTVTPAALGYKMA